MAQAALSSILDQLDTLQAEELHQLEDAVRERLTARERAQSRASFHQALRSSGLVKEIKQTRNNQHAQHDAIAVNDGPVSETILEERR